MKLSMKNLSRLHSRDRFREALDQRLPDNPSPSELHSIYGETIEELLKISDWSELDHVSYQIASDPDDIDFPYRDNNNEK